MEKRAKGRMRSESLAVWRKAVTVMATKQAGLRPGEEKADGAMEEKDREGRTPAAAKGGFDLDELLLLMKRDRLGLSIRRDQASQFQCRRVESSPVGAPVAALASILLHPPAYDTIVTKLFGLESTSVRVVPLATSRTSEWWLDQRGRRDDGSSDSWTTTHLRENDATDEHGQNEAPAARVRDVLQTDARGSPRACGRRAKMSMARGGIRQAGDEICARWGRVEGEEGVSEHRKTKGGKTYKPERASRDDEGPPLQGDRPTIQPSIHRTNQNLSEKTATNATRTARGESQGR
ncbi:hypothetical protein EV714DRAFT_240200 [Schizophyllum commune]